MLKQLVDGGFIEQLPGPQDRRQRLLYPTESGRALALRLLDPQERRLRCGAGRPFAGRAPGAERFLRRVIDAGEQRQGRQPDRTVAVIAEQPTAPAPASPSPTTRRTSSSSTTTSASARSCRAISAAHGFRVTVAADAADARRRLAGLAFDLLIVDVMMPGENGLDLTRSLRETMNVPILMLTARAEIENRIKGLESGADDYLAKPFEPRELLLRINNILRRGAAASTRR